MFMSRMMPGVSKPELEIATEMQRRSASPENAERFFRSVAEFDVRHLLPHVTAPTLVMHVKGEVAVPVEAGRDLASRIAGAKFVEFEGRNHIFRPYDPAAKPFFQEIDALLGHDR
jgi:pimeloyl-ACP methyl ester carboxylesterase